MSEKSIIFRKMCAASDAERDAGLTTPPEVERFDDIQYGTDSKWHLLDVYRPRALKWKLPVIVSFHGGGWVYGDKNVYQFYCMELAKRGFAVVNYSYRLAPEDRYPAPYEDTNEVFRWLLENADNYGFDTDNIFGVGDSAGALGIAIYALIVTDPGYAKNYSFAPPAGLKLRGLGLSCGLYKVRDSRTVATLRDFLRDEDYPGALDKLNLIELAGREFPPCFIMTAVGDFLRGEAPLLEQRLDKVGVRYESKVYGTAEEPLGHVFHCNVRLPEAAQANDDMCAFFRTLISE
jgi:acetyl esterase/lipase